MEDRGLAGKTLCKTVGELRRKTDLRNEDERGLARRQEMFRCSHVDFGFPAAGDTVEEDGMEAVVLEDGIQSARLVLGQMGAG